MVNNTQYLTGGKSPNPLSPPTNFAAKAGNAQITLTWTDPPNATSEPSGQTIATWAYTLIVRKEGSQPTGPSDGTVVVQSSVRDQYATTGFVDTGLTNDTLYCYGAFAYNSDKVVSEGAFVSATPLSFDPVLNNNSWAQISDASAAGIGSSLWSVGDTKEVTISGTVGTQAFDTTLCVYILGFDHNSTIEGKGITFGGFKTALSGGINVCLVDSNYNGRSTGGFKWFNMNHSSNTNSGGWKGCDLRYDVLGSTDVNDSDATSTCPTSPVANTLMAALPSDLRAVMKPMNIYTDNAGGGYDFSEYVTKSVDYLPLLAEYEIFGTRSYANSAEQNYQAQYQYYKNGNSKVKYRHSSTSSTALWWERSPNCNNSNNFCIVNTYGYASSYSARSSLGLAPAFRV